MVSEVRLTGRWTRYGSAIFMRRIGFSPPAGEVTPFGRTVVCTEGPAAAVLLGAARYPWLWPPTVG